MGLITVIAAFLGRMLKEVLPALFDEIRKPRRTKQIGGSDELKKDVQDSVDDMLAGRGRTGNPGVRASEDDDPSAKA